MNAVEQQENELEQQSQASSPLTSKSQKIKDRKAAAIAKVKRVHSACLIQARIRGVLARARYRIENKSKPARRENRSRNSDESPSVWPSTLKESFPNPNWPVLDDEDAALRWLHKTKKLFFRTITWNLCGQQPPPITEARKVLLPGSRYHFYFIGSEECERTIAQSAINPSKKGWEEYLNQALGPSYVPIRSHTLQAIHLMCFAHTSIAKYVRGVSSAAVATGIGNTLGNKGGVGIFLCVGNTSFVVVNAHAAAHQNAVKQRDSDCNRICTEMPWLLSLKNSSRVQSMTKSAMRTLGSMAAKLSDDHVLSQYDDKLGLKDVPQGNEPIGLSALPGVLTDERDDIGALKTDSKSKSSDGSKLETKPSGTDESKTTGISAEMGNHSHMVAAPDSAAEAKVPMLDTSKLGNNTTSHDTHHSAHSSQSHHSAEKHHGHGNHRNSHRVNPEDPVVPNSTNESAPPLSSARGVAEMHHFKRLGDASHLNECADRVIFMGDLNYRIHGKRAIIDTLLENNMYDVLLANDQLKKSMLQGHVLVNFTEPPLNFRPTYKFDHNSDIYDTSRKKRSPAWTDRILYVNRGINCLSYDADFDLKSSDHRPVFATFTCDVDINLPHHAESFRGSTSAAPSVRTGQHDHNGHSSGPVPNYSSESQVCSIM